MSQNLNTTISASMPQAKIVTIKRRSNQGFGFTLRHFIAYPPESEPKEISESQIKAMETVFIKEVHPNGPAYHANLKTGDRVLMVNNIPIAGVAYSTIVSMIKKTPSELKLLVVPKECDVLQMHYNSIAHTSHSNVTVSTTTASSIKCLKESGTSSGTEISSSIWKAFEQPQDIAGNGFSISRDIVSSPNESRVHQFFRNNLCSVSSSNQIKLAQQQQNTVSTFNTPNVILDNSTLMTRLHESIKQKEEFLRSPLPTLQQVHPVHQDTRTQLSAVSMSKKSSQNLVGGVNQSRETPVRILVDPRFSSACEKPYARIIVNNSTYNTSSSGALIHKLQLPFSRVNNTLNSTSIDPSKTNSGVVLYDRNKKDLVLDTGVTNEVFERKLFSHFNINFDPFKPLSINTNDVAALPNDVILMKEPAVLFDPLHQKQIQHRHISEQQKKLQFNKTVVSEAVMSSTTTLTKSTCNNAPENSVVNQHFYCSVSTENTTPNTTKQHLDKNTYSDLQSCDNKLLSDSNKIEKRTTSLIEAGKKDQLDDVNNDQHVDVGLISEAPVVQLKSVNNKCNNNITDTYLNKIHSCSAIVRRFKSSDTVIANKSVRRISYLRATNQENDFRCDNNNQTIPNTDILYDNALTNSEVTNVARVYDVTTQRNSCCDHQSSARTEDNYKLKKSKRASFGSDILARGNFDLACALEIKDSSSSNKFDSTDLDLFETEVDMKSSCINGKQLTEYRLWRQVKIEIKGDILKIYPNPNMKTDSNVIELNVKNFNVLDESLDKRKYICRMLSKQSPLAYLANELSLDDPQDKITGSLTQNGNALTNLHQQQPHTDIMFKTRSSSEMKRILSLLQWKHSNDGLGRQTAEPQQKAATTSIPTVTICDESVRQQHIEQKHSIIESLPLSTSCNESEVSNSISPVLKSRKSYQKNVPKPLGSPKAKNWKDLLFRRGAGNANFSNKAGTPQLNAISCERNYGSIGVPLKMCPMSKTNEYVPMLVDVCTNIVETKGLGVVGIYRIPGNKAAISELSEQVNMKDFSWDSCLTDVRWVDVNVVSSLLKLFIRSLPDALLPSSFYDNFIEADKKQDHERLTELKHLLNALPRHSYETMKHLFRHLNHVSKNCQVNLMEPKNLAIIFGPSIIRTPNDTLDIAVKDMKYQCRIVELLLTQYDYFFENGDLPDLKKVSGNNLATASPTVPCDNPVIQQNESQTDMLLHNISKIEKFIDRDNGNSVRTSRFIPQLRKRAQNKRNSDTYSADSVLSLDYTKSPCVTTTSSSSCSSTTPIPDKALKKKERGFLAHGIRSHNRKGSPNEKDSASCSSIIKGPRGSVDTSILLTDDDSNHSRNSDSGSMSLGVITDTLNSKLSKLRKDLVKENIIPDFTKNRRHTLDQPLNLQCENIPYADESPERHFQLCNLDNANKINKKVLLSNSFTSVPVVSTTLENIKQGESSGLRNNNSNTEDTYKLQHSATAPVNISPAGNVATKVLPISSAMSTKNNGKSKSVNMGNSNTQRAVLRFPSSIYNICTSDSEGSTTSDQKDVLIVTAPTIVEKFYKKRKDYRLFRSASFNCRNYMTRSNGSGNLTSTCANLTKDEKTDMNLTKKRQIQNKQNRSIKRRHTVGGPHDYNSNECVIVNNCNRYCKCKNCNLNASTTTTMVIKRIPLSITNMNIAHKKNNIIQHNNNEDTNSNISNENNCSSSSGDDPSTSIVNMPSEHVLEVDIRIKNISRNRFQS